MILILEIGPPHAAKLGSASRQTFRADGGTIGRATDCDWVLPHTKVSGHHAVIAYRDGTFYIEDRSKNGVCLNSTSQRLAPGRPHALKSGDRVLIDPYEIDVLVTSESQNDARRPSPAPPLAFGSVNQVETDDPFAPSDPFEPHDPFQLPRYPSSTPNYPQASLEPDDSLSGQELDPLKLLGGEGGAPKRAAPVQRVQTARDLERSSPLEGHYAPPAVQTPPPVPSRPVVAPPPHVPLIPDDYDPLAPDDPPAGSELAAWDLEPFEAPILPAPVEPAAPLPSIPPAATMPPVSAVPAVSAAVPAVPPVSTEPPAPATPLASAPPPPMPAVVDPFVSATPHPAPAPPQETPARDPGAERGASDLAAVLVAADLGQVEVTPELAESFGRILRVVVAGVMDVLRSRQEIRAEFRMRMTQFRPADNNPLKFSVDADDALFNLLVKKPNAKFLGPVEAFEDAFADLRNHQLAMLAGMRTAFEFMLSEFDPDHLQEKYDRQLKKGSLLSVPAKLRYWDLYREQREEMAKDPEASFRKFFGEEFAKAYEEQLRQLKAQGKT